MHINNIPVGHKSSYSKEEEDKVDEELKLYTSEDPVIKGNKSLNAEVKLSDFVKFC